MNREELAARIYVRHFAQRSSRDKYDCSIDAARAFDAADDFLKEAERQRKQLPSECEHLWGSHNGLGKFYCLKCSIEKPKIPFSEDEPEPEKCAHKHEWPNAYGVCLHCGTPFTQPNGLVLKWEAREVWVEFFSNGQPRAAWSKQSADNAFVKFREVLPNE